MSNTQIRDNDVNGTGTDPGEGSSSGRGTRGQQQVPGRQQATARKTWNKEVNKRIMRCYIESNPSARGYRKRILAIWKEIGVFEVTEQRLADQVRAIKVNGWLSEVEIEEIRRNIKDKQNDTNEAVITIENPDVRVNISPEDNSDEGMSEILNSGHQTISGQNQINEADMSDEQVELAAAIRAKLLEENELPPQNLRAVDRKKLKEATQAVNNVIKKLDTKNISETNRLTLAGANVVADLLQVKRKQRPKKEQNKEPWWKQRMKQIKELRRDLSKLDQCSRSNLKDKDKMEYLESTM